MAQRILRLSLYIVCAVLAACAPSSGSKLKSGEKTFSTDDVPPPANHVALIEDQHNVDKLPAYVVPEKLRERLKEVAPEIPQPELNTSFSVEKHNLHISVKEKTFTFTGTLKIPGKQDEKLEMRCSFDPAQAWECSDMLPVDEKIAEQRRLQATVNCLDDYRCTQLGIELFVVVGGKTQSQLFQTKPFTVRRAESGDAYHDDEDTKEGDSTYTPPQNKDSGEYVPPKGGDTEYVPPKSKNSGEYVPPSNGGDTKYQPPGTTETPKSPKVYEKPTNPGAQMEPELESAPQPQQRATPPASPTPQQAQPQPQQPAAPSASEYEEEEESMTDEELEEAMNDANQAVEISTPINMPVPAARKNSIPGIEKMRTEVGKGIPNQARGTGNNGSLRDGKPLPKSGRGYICTSDRNYGTDMMIDMIVMVSAAMEKKAPNMSKVVVRDISKKTGGDIGHKSHKNGLDVDISFPSMKTINGLWPACDTYRGTDKRGRRTTVCKSGRAIYKDLDEARFWFYLKTFTNGAPTKNGKMVGAIYLDAQIKKHMCAYARGIGEDISEGQPGFEALRVIKHEGGHHNHIHVRLKCPGNRDCKPAPITLAKGTGC